MASIYVNGTLYRVIYNGASASFATVRGQANATTLSTTSSSQITIGNGGSVAPDTFQRFFRAFAIFDVSALPAGATPGTADFTISLGDTISWNTSNDPPNTSFRDICFFAVASGSGFNFGTPTAVANYGALTAAADAATGSRSERDNAYVIDNTDYTFTFSPYVVSNKVVVGMMQAFDFDNEDPFSSQYSAGGSLWYDYGIKVVATKISMVLRYSSPPEVVTPTIATGRTRTTFATSVTQSQDVGPTTLVERGGREIVTDNGGITVIGGVNVVVPDLVERNAREVIDPVVVGDSILKPDLVWRQPRYIFTDDFAVVYNPKVLSPTYTVPNDFIVNSNDSGPAIRALLRMKGDEPIEIEYAETITAQIYEFEDANLTPVLAQEVDCSIRNASNGEVEFILPGSGTVPRGRYIIVWKITWGGQGLTSQVPTDFFYTVLTVEA